MWHGPLTPNPSPAKGRGEHGGFRAVLPRSWWWFVAMYAPLGVAALAKGPVGVVLPVACVWSLGVDDRREHAVEPPPPVPLAPFGRGARGEGPPPETVGSRLAELSLAGAGV